MSEVNKSYLLSVRSVGRNPENPSLRSTKENYVEVEQRLEINGNGDICNTLSTVQKDNYILSIIKYERDNKD